MPDIVSQAASFYQTIDKNKKNSTKEQLRRQEVQIIITSAPHLSASEKENLLALTTILNYPALENLGATLVREALRYFARKKQLNA